MKTIAIIILLTITISSCSNLNKAMGWKDDNPVEEAAEFLIEEETGAKVDLTSESPDESHAQEMPKKQADQKNVPKKDKIIDA